MASRDRERALASVAKRQHGPVARDQLIDLGFSPRAITTRLESNRLRVIHEGVYAIAPHALSRDGNQMAALLAIRPDPLLTHTSSAARQRLMAEGNRIHVSIATRATRRMRGVIVHRPRRIDPEDRIRIDGFPMTSIPRTLLDLGQILPHAALRKVVEAAERTDQLDPRAIEDVIARYPGHRGRRALRRILSGYLWTPRANEGIEEDFQALLAEFRLPKPQVNVLVENLLVDCWWPEHRFVVELDSRGWHKTWDAHERDRKRDAVLLRAGIPSLRITYRRIHEEAAVVAADVRAGLALPIHPGPD
jgi:very-short-patch-repair endonuclease